MSAVAGNIEILADIPFFLWIVEDIAEALLIQNSFDISDDYIALAKNYYNIYNKQRNFYYTNFQNTGNGELGLLNLVFNTPLQPQGLLGTVYNPAYLAQSNQIEFFGGTEIQNIDWWQNRANMYGDKYFQTGNDGFGNPITFGSPQYVDELAAWDDFTNYLYRYEEHRKDVYDERTWEWQNQALNFAVKQASVVESGLATSFKFLDTATNGMADFFATQANGISRYASFRKSYTDTAQQLRASSQKGKNLAISTNLGVDISTKSYPIGTNLSSNPMFMDVEDSVTYQSIQK